MPNTARPSSSKSECRVSRRGQRRGGFSFTEILFAVMILGIGFIMVAAMFPVAIRQTEATHEETIAASVGRSGTDYLSQLAGVSISVTNLTAPFASPNPYPTSALLPTFAAGGIPATLTIPAGQTSATLTGAVWSLNDPRDTYRVAEGGTTSNHSDLLWRLVSPNLIQPADPRFAWVAMYRRDLIAQGAPGSTVAPTFAPYAQVILVVAQSRAKPAYAVGTNLDITRAKPTWYANLEPRPFTIQLTNPAFAGGPCTVTFVRQMTPGGGLAGYNVTNTPVAEGALLVISDDNVGITSVWHGQLNGRVYRIGTSVSATGNSAKWQLAPGSDLTLGDQLALNSMLLAQPGLILNAFVVGRAPDPNITAGANQQYTGNPQDVSVYTTYVQVPN